MMNSLRDNPDPTLDWIDDILVSATGGGASVTKPRIQWQISPCETGVHLSVWEPAPVSGDRLNPYLFMANYRLDSEAQAHQILQQYL